MRITLALLTLVLLAGCGGGSSKTRTDRDTPAPGAPDATAGSVRLTLDVAEDGGQWRVNLRAPGARDLYQVAGTLSFDAAAYDVVAVEAGGGLGTPADSYFVSDTSEPGRVNFAYTRRFHGPGVDGDAWLVSLRVTPRGDFRAADFSLYTAEGRLLARDSARRPLSVEVAR